MGVSKNRGTPKWMVYNGKPYENGWFGDTTIFGNTHIYNFMQPSFLKASGRLWDDLHVAPLSGPGIFRSLGTDLWKMVDMSPKTKDKLITFRNPSKKTGVKKKYQLSLYGYLYKYSEVQRCALYKLFNSSTFQSAPIKP